MAQGMTSDVAVVLTDSTFGHRLWTDNCVFHDEVRQALPDLPHMRFIGGNGGSATLFGHQFREALRSADFNQVFYIPPNDACEPSDYLDFSRVQAGALAQFGARVRKLQPIMELEALYRDVCFNAPYWDSSSQLYKARKKHLRRPAFDFVARHYLGNLAPGTLLLCCGWNAYDAQRESEMQVQLLQPTLTNKAPVAEHEPTSNPRAKRAVVASDVEPERTRALADHLGAWEVGGAKDEHMLPLSHVRRPADSYSRAIVEKQAEAEEEQATQRMVAYRERRDVICSAATSSTEPLVNHEEVQSPRPDVKHIGVQQHKPDVRHVGVQAPEPDRAPEPESQHRGEFSLPGVQRSEPEAQFSLTQSAETETRHAEVPHPQPAARRVGVPPFEADTEHADPTDDQDQTWDAVAALMDVCKSLRGTALNCLDVPSSTRPVLRLSATQREVLQEIHWQCLHGRRAHGQFDEPDSTRRQLGVAYPQALMKSLAECLERRRDITMNDGQELTEDEVKQVWNKWCADFKATELSPEQKRKGSRAQHSIFNAAIHRRMGSRYFAQAAIQVGFPSTGEGNDACLRDLFAWVARFAAACAAHRASPNTQAEQAKSRLRGLPPHEEGEKRPRSLGKAVNIASNRSRGFCV